MQQLICRTNFCKVPFWVVSFKEKQTNKWERKESKRKKNQQKKRFWIGELVYDSKWKGRTLILICSFHIQLFHYLAVHHTITETMGQVSAGWQWQNGTMVFSGPGVADISVTTYAALFRNGPRMLTFCCIIGHVLPNFWYVSHLVCNKYNGDFGIQIFFFFFFFLRSPAISLGFTTFGWDFCVCDRFLIQPLR